MVRMSSFYSHTLFKRWRIFFCLCSMEEYSRQCQIAMVHTMFHRLATLLTWLRQKRMCGVAFRNHEVPFGAPRLVAMSCLCGPGRVSLGATTSCTWLQHRSNLTVTSPCSTFPASALTVTKLTSWHLHLCAAAWSTCEKGILTVRLWTQAHRNDVIVILGARHLLFLFPSWNNLRLNLEE